MASMNNQAKPVSKYALAHVLRHTWKNVNLSFNTAEENCGFYQLDEITVLHQTSCGFLVRLYATVQEWQILLVAMKTTTQTNNHWV